MTTPTAAKKRFKPSLGQEKILRAWPLKHKILLACAGEQGGKTKVGSLWFKRLVKAQPKKLNYIVGAPTYKIMEQATKPAFLQAFTGLGTYNGSDDVFTLTTGGKIYLRSAKDPDSVVGITDCAGAWIDEGGKCPRMFYYNITSRCARMGGPIIITTTPYAMNWIHRDIIVPHDKGLDPTILYAQWKSSDNPSYPKEEYDRLQKILPPSIFRRRLMGLHEKPEGLIFKDFDGGNWIENDQVEWNGLENYGGIDWGFDHPFALVVRGMKDGYAFERSVYKRSGLSVSQQLDLIEAKTRMFHVKHWSCGHDRPEMIEELNRRGIPAAKYFEYAPNYREVNAGNQKHAEMVRSKRYKVVRNIDQWEDLEDEYLTYCWERSEEDEERGREKPRDENNDLMSAVRYCTVGTLQYLTDKIEKPKVPLDYYQKRDMFDPRKKSKRSQSWDA